MTATLCLVLSMWSRCFHVKHCTCHLQEALTSICTRRPSHSFFSLSISAFSAAMAAVGRGCHWRKTKLSLWNRKEREKKRHFFKCMNYVHIKKIGQIVRTFVFLVIMKKSTQQCGLPACSCSTSQYSTGARGSTDPDTLIWNTRVAVTPSSLEQRLDTIPEV